MRSKYSLMKVLSFINKKIVSHDNRRATLNTVLIFRSKFQNLEKLIWKRGQSYY